MSETHQCVECGSRRQRNLVFIEETHEWICLRCMSSDPRTARDEDLANVGGVYAAPRIRPAHRYVDIHQRRRVQALRGKDYHDF